MRTSSLSGIGPRGGYTLAELAMVLVILAILASLAVPSLRGLDGSRQNVAATRIRSVLIHAQLTALDLGTDAWVVFDPARDRLTAFMRDPRNPNRAQRIPMPDPLTRADLSMQLGGRAGIESADFGGTLEVMFDSAGVPHDARGITLASDGSVVVTGGETIRVTRNTGLIRID